MYKKKEEEKEEEGHGGDTDLFPSCWLCTQPEREREKERELNCTHSTCITRDHTAAAAAQVSAAHHDHKDDQGKKEASKQTTKLTVRLQASNVRLQEEERDLTTDVEI